VYDFFKGDITYNDLNKYQKIKADWLENTTRYASSTKEAYWLAFNLYINNFELELDKELRYFTKEDVIMILNHISNNSLKSVKRSYDIINLYMNYISRTDDNFKNPCDEINIKEYINSKANKNKYESLQDFYDFILGLNCSDVDRMILVLVRYGVDIDDIGLIKWADIDKDNMVITINKENKQLNLPIDNLFLLMVDKAKQCFRYAPGQKLVEYVDYGYVIKASATVRWKSTNGSNCRNVIGKISSRNNIDRISVPDLMNFRKYDLLLKKYYNEKIIRLEDLKNIIELFEGEVTEGKLNTFRRNFELDNGIKVKRVNQQ
jgi:integrase